jgi:hypothetical protein
MLPTGLKYEIISPRLGITLVRNDCIRTSDIPLDFAGEHCTDYISRIEIMMALVSRGYSCGLDVKLAVLMLKEVIAANFPVKLERGLKGNIKGKIIKHLMI